ncbi:MAG: ATP-grasp domain-containing protein [Bifidobacteriaceae bacterium]|jgi:hypothetical protein|nr:ATP-grasp domain-containing protein [Bifidobacteriaceae bacterium]
MRTSREQLVRDIGRALGSREVYWFGTRGEDSRSLLDLGGRFTGSFTILNRPAWFGPENSLAYEDITGKRVDLDVWEIDDHPQDDATREFRCAMLIAMAKSDHAIVPYRPCGFLSALEFARQDRGLSLGMFAGKQHVFEHKPWVEGAVRCLGIDVVPWRYIADEEQLDAGYLLADGPVVVRPSRGSGGAGMAKVEDAADLAALWPKADDFFASVSPYLPDCLPLNIGGVVWDDGVTVHYPSVQLIGIPYCVGRSFGYCGNDFAACRDLDIKLIDQIESTARQIGAWLSREGYRGAFGADFMVDGDTVLFTEINPRFQGSTRMSADLSREVGEPCLLLDHMAAMLHLPCPEGRPALRDAVFEAPPRSQVVCHNTTDVPFVADVWSLTVAVRSLAGFRAVEVEVDPEVICEPGAVIASVAFDDAVTASGYELRPEIGATLGTLNVARPTPPEKGD